MIRSHYYEKMRQLALAIRIENGIETASLNLTTVRRIYKKEKIRIDHWDAKGRRLKAAYFCDETDCSVMVNKKLPPIPKLFALVHELKHHYVDREKIKNSEIECGDYNANELIEKSAEVFAAEFIYPEAEMRELIPTSGIEKGLCTPEKIVEFKRLCPAPISYQFLIKRFEWFGFIEPGVYNKVQFKKLEEKLYGQPFYTQNWFKLRRATQKH